MRPAERRPHVAVLGTGEVEPDPVERLADPTRRVDAVHRSSLLWPGRAHVGTEDRLVVEDRDERGSLLVEDLGGDGSGEARPRNDRADDVADRLAFAVVGVLEGTARERIQGDLAAVVLDGLERGPRDA
jgi:hypothetical protein